MTSELLSAELSSAEIVSELCLIVAKLIGTQVEPADDFFEIGGDSLLVVDYMTTARDRGLRFRPRDVYEHPTPAGLGELLYGRLHQAAATAAPTAALPALEMTAAQLWRTHLPPHHCDVPDCLVPLHDGDQREPLFVFHWGNGAVRFAADAAAGWAAGRPVYGFEAVGFHGQIRPLLSVQDMAERYLAELLDRQPHGPYHLVAVCLGGTIAIEVARRLRERMEEVRLLALIKPPTLDPFIEHGWGLDEINRFRIDSLKTMFNLSASDSLDRIFAALRGGGWYEDTVVPDDLPRLQLLWSALTLSLHYYSPRPYPGPVIFFQDRDVATSVIRNWSPLLPDLITHWFDYGVESALPVMNDPLVASELRARLQ